MKQFYTIINSFAMVPAMVALSIHVVAQSPTIAITEIMYNPPEIGTDTLEYLEIHNYGETAIVLDGYYFGSGLTGTFEPANEGENIVLEAGAYGLLVKNTNAFISVMGAGLSDAVLMQWSETASSNNGLSNSGEGLSLYDAGGTLVDTVWYSNGATWPGSAAGNGASLERCDPTSDGTSVDSWEASTNATGILVNEIEILATPGAIGSGCVTVGTIESDGGSSVFTAFPNPSTSGIFRLSERTSGAVYDMLGKEIKSMVNMQTLDLSAYPTGLYVLRTEKGEVLRLMR